MRIVMSVLAVLWLAAPASATPIGYTFSGVMSSGSSITRANGAVIDIAETAFTVTGITAGVDPQWAGFNPDGSNAVFLASSVYDFGLLGTFVTDVGQDQYIESYERAADNSRMLDHVGLATWYPHTLDGYQGFMAEIAPVPVLSLGLDPLVLGAITPLSTVGSSQGRQLVNAAGDRFTMAFSPFNTPLTIASGDIKAVPEPATLTLLSLGAAGGALIKRRRARLASRSNQGEA